MYYYFSVSCKILFFKVTSFGRTNNIHVPFNLVKITSIVIEHNYNLQLPTPEMIRGCYQTSVGERVEIDE